MTDYQKLAHLAEKSFPGHAGRPGQRGGSMPRAASGGGGGIGGGPVKFSNPPKNVGGLQPLPESTDKRSFKDRAAAYDDDEDFHDDVAWISKELRGEEDNINARSSVANEIRPNSKDERLNMIAEAAFRKSGTVLEHDHSTGSLGRKKELEFDPKDDKYVVSEHIYDSGHWGREPGANRHSDYKAAWNDLTSKH